MTDDVTRPFIFPSRQARERDASGVARKELWRAVDEAETELKKLREAATSREGALLSQIPRDVSSGLKVGAGAGFEGGIWGGSRGARLEAGESAA